MRKYWQIFRLSWQSILVYRFSFIMWRVRLVIDFLTIYFFWWAVFFEYQQIGAYSRQTMLSYLLVAALLRALVFSTVSYSACVEIANGDLNNYLIKPINYLKYWLSRDWADKLLNLLLFSVEFVLLILILKLPLVFPTDFWQWCLFIVVAFIAAIMYFFFSFLFSSFSFWYPEHEGWPMRFLMLMLLDFLSGIAFPLDIFPKALIQLFKLLPFYYFIFFPAQIYLGRLTGQEIISGFMIMLVWLAILVGLTKYVWKKGLTIYGAYGR